MKCPVCNLELKVRSGSPVKFNEKIYWKQEFTCDNKECQNYDKRVGERLVNIFDESDIVQND